MIPKTVLFLLVILFTFNISACAAAEKKLKYKVLNRYPHDTTAFTQGLFYHKGHLYESTGQHGHSSMRKVEIKTGRVLQIISLPDITFGEGATISGQRIYQLTWHSGIALIYESDSLSPAGSIKYPERFEGWGITSYKNNLYISDGSNRLRIIEPSGFSIRRYLKVTRSGNPLYYINELEAVGNHIYANIWQSTEIVKINPQSGKVTASVDLKALVPSIHKGHPDNVLNGIAWNSAKGTFYITGKKWNTLYEIEISD